MVPEKNLLAGILAVQLKYVTPQELAHAGSQWAADQGQDICTILLEQGTITALHADILRQLVEQQIQFHGGDASAALATFGGNSAVQESFAASIIYEMVSGVSFSSVNGGTRRGVEGTKRVLLDPAQLNTEQPGRYTIKGEQGRGGVGRVLIAFDEQIGREIALKELLPDSATTTIPAADSPMRKTATATARFLREARITGQLEHPGIVPVYELGQRADGNTYYTMKLVRGETLADRLKRCRDISDRLKLLPHFLDLCQAIAYAHSRGVIHRDIKPSNVMLGEFGETVLLDWGLAKVQGQEDEGAQKLADEIRLLKEIGASATVEGKPIGTPSYMPPEQADGLIEKIDERSDVWSLGAVLYEVLTGQPPYAGNTALEVIGKVLSDPVTPILDRQKDAPGELVAIAETCLNRDSRKRYASVETIADDINAYLSGGMVSAYTYSTGLLMKRWARRNWAVVGAACAVFVVLAVSIMILVAQNNLLANRQVELMVRSLNASANSLLQYRNDRWQTGMLLALQARSFESRQHGTISGGTATTLRGQLSDYPLGSTRLAELAGAVRNVSFSPDGQLLAAACDDGLIRVWQVDNLAADPAALKGHDGAVVNLAFSPDGRLLASAGKDGTVRIWKIEDLTAAPQVLRGHEGAVWELSFSPDGSLLVSAGSDFAVLVWQVDDLAAQPRMLRGHERHVVTGAIPNRLVNISFSPDGSLLAFACVGCTIRVWQVADLTADPQVLKGHPDEGLMDLTFSLDGRLLAAAGADRTVRIWECKDLAAEPCVLRGHEGAVYGLSFSPDGNLLASCGRDFTVRIWQVDDPAAEPQVLSEHAVPVFSVSFSPDGRRLAAAGRDFTVRLWQVDDLTAEARVLRGQGNMEVDLPYLDRVINLSFNPDSNLLASAGYDGGIRIWQVSDLTTEPQELIGHEVAVWHVSFSPDGSLLASAGYDGTVQVRQVGDLNAEPQVLRGNEDNVYGLAFSPDGSLLVSDGLDKTIRVWQVADLTADPLVLRGQDEEIIEKYINGSKLNMSFSPDGRLLAAAGRDRLIRVWQVDDLAADPQVLRSHEVRIEDLPLFGWALNICFSPDGKLLASAGDDGKACIWQVDDLAGEPQVLKGHEGTVVHLSFSPDGSLLVSAGDDGTIRVWAIDELTAKPQVLWGHEGGVREISFSPDGRLLASGGEDGTIRVWQADDLSAEPQVLKGHDDAVWTLSFSPDSSLLASGGRDNTIRVWQVDDLSAQPQVLKGHTGGVKEVIFSPDGSLLASVAIGDETVRVWQLDINVITAMIEHECFRNLSWSEWQMYVGKSVPYERTIPGLPLGAEVPYDGAIAAKT